MSTQTTTQESTKSETHPRSVEWLGLALVLAVALVATFAMVGTLSTGTSVAVMAVLVGTFVLAVGTLFGVEEEDAP